MRKKKDHVVVCLVLHYKNPFSNLILLEWSYCHRNIGIVIAIKPKKPKKIIIEKSSELCLLCLLRGKKAKKGNWLSRASGTQEGSIDMKLAVVLLTPRTHAVGIMLFGNNTGAFSENASF